MKRLGLCVALVAGLCSTLAVHASVPSKLPLKTAIAMAAALSGGQMRVPSIAVYNAKGEFLHFQPSYKEGDIGRLLERLKEFKPEPGKFSLHKHLAGTGIDGAALQGSGYVLVATGLSGDACKPCTAQRSELEELGPRLKSSQISLVELDVAVK